MVGGPDVDTTVHGDLTAGGGAAGKVALGVASSAVGIRNNLPSGNLDYSLLFSGEIAQD